MAYQCKEGWKAKVFDRPSRTMVTMCSLVNGKWKDVIFPTQEKAEEAERKYNKFWADKYE